MRFAALVLLLLPALTFADDGLVPYVMDWSKSDESVVDLSRFLEAPAGANGFIRRNGELLVKPDGTRFRIWGVNITGGLTFPDRETADAVADDLARNGFNAVRFHHLDPDWFEGGIFGKGDSTLRLDLNMLDKFDYMVAALKKRGIYTNINLNVMRRYRKDDGVRDHDKLGLGKGATYFNPRLIELQKEYARQLLTHVNPYTGNAYSHEPAVITIELVNENALVEAWLANRLTGRDVEWADTWSPIPPSYDAELTEQFNAFLAKRYPEELASFREATGVAADALVPRSPGPEIWKRPRDLFRAEAEFIVETEQAFFEQMRSVIKDEIGAQSLLVGSADHNDTLPGFPHIKNNMLLDIIDGHGYWKHPSLGEKVSADNVPMVNDPLDSTVVQFARTPVTGYPYTISETNHPFPHEYAAEGFAILTSYALFHDWDGIYWFSYKQGRTADPAKDGVARNSLFAVDADPIKMACIQACALTWHRHDVKRADEFLYRPKSESELFNDMRSDYSKLRPYYEPTFALTTPLEHATRWEFAEYDDPQYPTKSPVGNIVTDTGEIAWKHANAKTGVVTVDTPKSQSVVGFVSSHGETTANLNPAGIKNRFATLQLTSLDDLPIAESERLLFVHAGKATNSGFEWEPPEEGRTRRTVKTWGAGPTVIEPITGWVQLRGMAVSRVTVQPLAANGTLLGDAQTFDGERGDVWIEIGKTPAAWSLITTE